MADDLIQPPLTALPTDPVTMGTTPPGGISTTAAEGSAIAGAIAGAIITVVVFIAIIVVVVCKALRYRYIRN